MERRAAQAQRIPSKEQAFHNLILNQRVDANTDVRVIQVLLGHAKLTTAAQYTNVATKTVKDTVSPYEMLSNLQDQTLRRSLLSFDLTLKR